MLNGEEAGSFRTLVAVGDGVSGSVVTDKLKEMTEADHAGPVGQWKDSGFSSKRDFKGKGRRLGGSCRCPTKRKPWLIPGVIAMEEVLFWMLLERKSPSVCCRSYVGCQGMGRASHIF